MMARKPMVCHIDRVRGNFASSEVAAHPSLAAITTPDETLYAILEPCKRCRELPGELTSWSEKTAAIIKAAIPVRRYAEHHPKCVDTLCDEAGTGRQRALSSKKLDLLCIYLCCPVQSESERKKCSKLGKLLSRAHAENVAPEDAATWLKGVRLTDVTRRSDPAKANGKFAVRFSIDGFPLLAADSKAGAGWPINAEAAAVLEKAAHRCEELLRTLVSPEHPADHASAE